MKNLILDKRVINPISLLILMSIAMPIAFNTWSAMLNNFVVEKAAFTGVEIGILPVSYTHLTLPTKRIV